LIRKSKTGFGSLTPAADGICNLAVPPPQTVPGFAPRPGERPACHDGLAGVLDRQIFIGHLESLLYSARNGVVVVVWIDVRRFHDLIGAVGYGVGDELLQQVTDRLRDMGMTAICRLGSNAFAVAKACADRAGAVAATAAIGGRLSPAYAATGTTIVTRFDMGYVVGTEGSDAMTLLRHAELALQRSKAVKCQEPREFDLRDETEARWRMRLTDELQQAIADDAFAVYYQPQVDLNCGRVVGAEALLRWRHALFGMQLPGRFIEHAEDTGLIVEIGARSIRAVAEFAARINAGRADPLVFAVNVSPVEFRLRNLPNIVADALTRAGARPQWLTLELTEGLMLDGAPDVLAVMGALREIGVGIAIDDFGTGYANLRYLEDFPITGIKLDRCFTRGLGAGRSKRIIVEALVRLSEELGYRLVAEGVETAEERQSLLESGCRCGQGFLFGEAVDGDDFLRGL
jgi:diguanylate cyclase (GGDEF)-like protein